MGWLKSAWQWARVADVVVSLGEVALRLILSSSVVALVIGVATWSVTNPLAAVAVGLVAWIVVAIGYLLLQSKQQAIVGAKGVRVSQPGGISADTDPSQAQDNEPPTAYAEMAIDQLAKDDFESFKRNVFELGLAALSERSFQIERASIDKGRL